MPVQLRFSISLLWLMSVCAASAASAQETREAAWAAEQERKAAAAIPYEPGAAERWVSALQRRLIAEPSGFYPYFASVYSGGGFTLGGGYRHYLGDRSHGDLKGLYSVKGYKLFEASTDSWGHRDGRIDLHGRVGWRDATEVPYYDLGMSGADVLAQYRLRQLYAGGEVHVRPARFTFVTAGISYEDFTIDPADAVPADESGAPPAPLPDFDQQRQYAHTILGGGLDWRPAAGYARRGGLYQLTYHNFAELDGGNTFDRLDGEIVQHLPVLRETWVVSVRGRVESTLHDSDEVPFFLLPSLGSGSTLRAYSSWRFRDRHSLLMSGELRWIPNRSALDMAVFYDAGKVTPRWDDLSLAGLKSNVGIGIRFHSLIATPLRIELAKGSEGFNLVFSGSASF